MKRITINVDLDDNELLDEEIVKAVRGYAKQIARSEMETTIQKEIQRLVTHAIDNDFRVPASRFDSGGQMYRKVRDAVNDAFKSNGDGGIQAVLRPIIREEIQHVEPSDVEKIVREAVTKETDKILASVKEMMMNELLKIVAKGLTVGDFVKQ